MSKNKITIILLLILPTLSSFGQQTITLDEVIAMGLANNFGLKIAKNDITIADNNASLSNAGLLPSLDLNVNGNISSLNTAIEFSGGLPSADESSAISSYLIPSLDLSYTIYDGGKNIFKLKSLKEQINKEKINFTANIERTIIDIINAYYNIVNTQAELNNNMGTYHYSLQRYENIATEVKYGQNTALEKITALGYVNNDSMRIMNTRLLLQRGILDLNSLLGQNILSGNEIFATTIDLKIMDKQILMAEMFVNNTDIKSKKSSVYSSKLDLKSAKYFYMPKLSLKASYGYSNQQFEVGTMLSNTTLGPSIGFTLSRNVTSGGKNQKAYNNTKISYENAQISLAETKFNLKRDFEKAWLNYQYYLTLIPIEKSNVEIANERFKKTRNQYKKGQASNLEFRDAQLNLSKAKSSLNEIKISAKLAEWELLKIAGLLRK